MRQYKSIPNISLLPQILSSGSILSDMMKFSIYTSGLRRLCYLLCSFLLLMSISTTIYAQQNRSFETELDIQSIRKKLEPLRNEYQNSINKQALNQTNTRIISLPIQEGSMQQFQVNYAPILSDDLAAKYPEINTYQIQGLTDPSLQGRMSLTPSGMEVFLPGKEKGIQIKPIKENPKIYRVIKGEEEKAEREACQQFGASLIQKKVNEYNKQVQALTTTEEEETDITNGTIKRTYRLAVIGTGEFYEAYRGSPASEANATSVLVRGVSAVTAIYERELAVSFVITHLHIYTNSRTDPFIPGIKGREFQAADAVGNKFGLPDPADPTKKVFPFDIGHVWHHNPEGSRWKGGGVALLGVVCQDNVAGDGPWKAAGWTGSRDNTTGAFYRLAAHEFGHMFGANHTFNGSGKDCNGNISTSTSYEIGSGSTIMSYQGICGDGQNIPGYEPIGTYFHHHSLVEMLTYIRGTDCHGESNTLNTPPVVNANPQGKETIVIPKGTPFTLTGSGMDADGSTITYTWEQLDEDGEGNPTQGKIGPFAGVDTRAPLFRSFPPSPDPSRSFPELSFILEGKNTEAPFEALSAVGRTITMVLTGRDNDPRGNGLSSSTIEVIVDPNAGPFRITSQNNSPTYPSGSTQTVSWDVAGTNGNQINCANVTILMSVDGGQSFPFTLAANTPNSGSASVQIPDNLAVPNARIKVMCTDGSFFDINDTDITITSDCQAQMTNFFPDEEMTLPEGDPGLNLELDYLVGEIENRITKSISAVAPQVALKQAEGVNSCNSSPIGDFKYDSFEFSVTASGTYSSLVSTGVQAIFQSTKADFDPNNPCNSTWLGSNGFGNTSSWGYKGEAISVNLVAGETYLMVGYPQGAAQVTFALDGPGDVVLPEAVDEDFGYTYLAVNTETETISVVSADADFTSLTEGTYEIIGLSYQKTGANPASFVGQPLSSLLFGGNCVKKSENVKILIVEGNECAITDILATATSDCNDQGTSDPSDDTFTAEVVITFENAPATGSLILTGAGVNEEVLVGNLSSATSHTFSDLSLPSDGEEFSFSASFSADPTCTFTKPVAGTAPDPCATAPCAITAISTANISACDDGGTPDPADDRFTADITVTFENAPENGLLIISGEGFSQGIPVGDLDEATSHTLVGRSLPANGQAISIMASFSEDADCTFTEENAGTAPGPCSVQPVCAITAISATNISTCDDGGTTDPSDDRFTADITITFENAPSSGLLNISGDGFDAGVPVGNLDRPTSHTIVGIPLTANGQPISISASFSADPTCSFTEANAGTAPGPCSVQPACAITAITTANVSTCDDGGTPDPSDDTFTADITVTYANAPSSGLLNISGAGFGAGIPVTSLDGPTSHTFVGRTFSANGQPISISASFSADQTCTFTEANAGMAPGPCSPPPPCVITDITTTNIGACNNQGTTTIFDDRFAADITVTFSDAPTSGTLNISGDGFAAEVNVDNINGQSFTFIQRVLPATGQPISITASFSEDPSCTFTEANTGMAPGPCSPPPACVITNITTTNISACNDQGTTDPFDDRFTADITVTFANPPTTGVLNILGTGFAFNAEVADLDGPTSHTFTDLALQTNGQPIFVSAFFTAEPNCLFTVENTGTAPESCSPEPCAITAISTSNISVCNDGGTVDPSDDTFTADITVTFSNAPESGLLSISGEGFSTGIPVANLDGPSSHTFVGRTLPSNGQAISVTASFTEDADCTFTEENAGTAPDACSPPPACIITDILATNITACNDQGTPDPRDDRFTADITVIFANPPSTGVLSILGNGFFIEVPVADLDGPTSHTLVSAPFRTNGLSTFVSASFSAEPGCVSPTVNIGTAPLPCSPPECVITDLTTTNISDCNDQGTTDPSDDRFTVNILVAFFNAPTSGFLNVSVNGVVSEVPVTELDGSNSHTLEGLSLPANGEPIFVSAAFTAEPNCILLPKNVGTAPGPCSPEPPTAGTKIYWSDCAGNCLEAPTPFTIHRANLDGTGKEELIPNLRSPIDIVPNVNDGKLYWIDEVTDKVQRSNLDGSSVEDLITSDILIPGGLGLDTQNGKMYWTALNSVGIAKVNRANLNGSGKEELYSGVDLLLDGIGVNPTANKMYWSELNADAVGIIKRANLDGSGVEDLIVLPGIERPREIELDIAGGKIYWINAARNRSSSKIQRANLDGSGIETLYSRNDADINGLALDLEAAKIYWTYNPAGTDQDRLRRSNLNGSNVEDLAISVFNPLDVTIVPAEAFAGPNFTKVEGSTSAPSGISITNGISMEVFPNPTKQLLNVQVEGLAAAKVDLVVYDLQGRRVLSQTLFTDTPVLRQQLDLRDLSEGMYSLVLLNNDQQVIKRFQLVK